MASSSLGSSTAVGTSPATNRWSTKTSPPFNDETIVNIQHSDEETKEPSTERMTGSSSSFKHLFVFTRREHDLLIIPAFFTSTLVAAGKTAYAIVLGKTFDIISKWGAGLLNVGEFLSQVSLWSGYTCLLGLGVWVAFTLDIALWVVTGELRARTAREAIFASFLKKSMEWYDSRESGMSSLIVATQT